MPPMDKALARELGHNVARFARERNENPRSYGYKSLIRGHYQVLLTKHPMLKKFKEDFFKAAGVEK